MSMTDVAPPPAPAPIPGERTLLIVEDNKSFLTRLARAMEQRGFDPVTGECREPAAVGEAHSCGSGSGCA